MNQNFIHKAGFAIFILCFILGCKQERSKIENFNHLELVDLNNNKIDLNKFKGKRTFVNFWATWCAPCIKEIPSILKAKEALEPLGYKFIFVSDEETDKINRFLERKNIKIESLKVKSSLEELNIKKLPLSIILDEDLKAISSLSGEQRWDSRANIKLLKQFLD